MAPRIALTITIIQDPETAGGKPYGIIWAHDGTVGETVDHILEALDDLINNFADNEQAVGPPITCPRCNRTSHNPHDIEQRHCGGATSSTT